MTEREYSATASRVYEAPARLVWALAADTNRWDRAAGMSAGQFSFRDVDGRWRRTATARQMGLAIEWYDPDFAWIEGEFVEAYRVFLRGPVARGGFRVRLSPVDPLHTRVTATAYMAGEGAKTSVVGNLMRTRFRSALDRYLGSIEKVLKADAGLVDEEPATYAVRRALLQSQSEVVSGARTGLDLDELDRRAVRFLASECDRVLAERLVAHLRERPDEEVSQMRPFELARAWSANRREVLRVFLLATRAGLVDMRWQINCPVCRVASRVAASLEHVRKELHCDACNVEYGIDFGEHVEAVFQCNAAIRQVETAVYCDSTPAFRPHVYAQLVLDGHAEQREAAALPIGSMLVRTLRGGQSEEVVVEEGMRHVEVRVEPERLSVELSEIGEGPAGITVLNTCEEQVVVLFERSRWSADAVLGTVVASFSDFLDLFATEAPASGVDLSIGTISLLFSDLTGSTALYERVGDARAFAVVEEHFQRMAEVVQAHDGAVVKTIGDAIMASFAKPADAVRAALAMVEANGRAYEGLGVDMRVGVHAGPCLVVRANERLDFFGTTVNMAARLEGKAAPGHLVLTEALAQDTSVAAVLEGRAREVLVTSVKGFREMQRLVAFPVRQDPA